MSVNLGDKVKCSITGFQGIAMAAHEYLHGCRRITVQPPVDKDGKVPESQTFDEPQLVVVKSEQHKRGSSRFGGPEKFSDKRSY